MKKVIYGVVVLAAFALLIGGFAWESAKEADICLIHRAGY